MPNVVDVCRAGTPGEAGSSQPIVLYQWTRLIPVISCQHGALSSLVLSTQIKLMKCNPLKCPGCISVTGLRTQEGRQGGSLRHGRETSPPLPNLGFKSTLINPLIQLIFDSQLIWMRRRWSGQDSKCLSKVRGPDIRRWEASRVQHEFNIAFSGMILATNKVTCNYNPPPISNLHIYFLTSAIRRWGSRNNTLGSLFILNLAINIRLVLKTSRKDLK